MKPLTETRAWPKLAVYDLEATEWVNIILVCHVDEHGNRKSFPTVAAWCDWLFSPEFESDHVWAHWGGHYDHRFLIQHATRSGWSWETVQSGGSIIIVSVAHPNGRIIHFGESARLLPDSVERIGKTVGLPKLDADRSNIGSLTQAQLVEYCFRDCDIVLRGLQHLRDALTAVGADFAYTLASIASRWVRRSGVLDWFRFYEKDANGKQVYSKRILAADAFCMPAYFGGRVECFKVGTFKGPLYYYDVRSSYPWSMQFGLPAYFAGFNPPLQRTIEALRKYAISEATVTVPGTMYLPPLAVRHEGKLIFPTGTFRGRWTNIELLAAYERGCKVELHGCADYKPLPFLSAFVRTFYGLRQEAIDSHDDFKSYAYKIALNSLYGKLVEAIERQSTVYGPHFVTRVLHQAARSKDIRVKPTSVPGVYAVTKEMDGPFRHVAAGAYVTARSRLRLLEGLERARALGGQVYYCDTDSIVTDVKLSGPLIGDALGSFKLESEFTEAEFVSPKVYRATLTDGKTIYKVKGMPVRGLTDSESQSRWHDYINGIGVERDGISGFRTDIRRGTVEPSREVLSRALRRHDTKRVHSDSNSIPLHYDKRDIATCHSESQAGDSKRVSGKRGT